jgi:uncharacterized protein YceK
MISARHLSSTIAFVAVVSTLLASGCATVWETVWGVDGPTIAQANQAKKDGDLEQLAKWCDLLPKMDKNLANSDGAQQSCAHEKALRAERANNEKLDSFNAGLSCDGVTDAYVEFNKTKPFPTERDTRKAFAAAGKKLASCEKFDELFGTFLAREVRPVASDPTLRQNYGLLVTLADEESVNVYEKILAFSESNDYSFEDSYYTSDAIVTFMMERGHADDCETFVDALDSNQVSTVRDFMTYAGWAKCRAAGATIADYLKTSENPDVRIHACETLGKIGDPAHRDIVELVAEKDSEVKIVREVKVYPVRDACSGTLVKLADN